MISRLSILLLCLIVVARVDASEGFYQVLPGKYAIAIIATDSEESYPIDIKFEIDDEGQMVDGEVEYPTYECKAIIRNGKIANHSLSFNEEMVPGFDSCETEKYTIRINREKLFSPSSRLYMSFSVGGGQDDIVLKTEKYKYHPTKYGKYRKSYKISNFNEILALQNSSMMREYLDLASNRKLIPQVKRQLRRLVDLENAKYAQLIKSSNSISDFESYIRSFPGSGHITGAKNKIAKIDLENLIASYRRKNTPESFYEAYLLSTDDNDVDSLLGEMDNLNKLLSFISNKPLLKSNLLIKNQLVSFYREQDSFEGYMQAFNVLNKRSDISSAYSSIADASKKQIVRKHSLDVFYNNYVTSSYEMDSFLSFLDNIENVDKSEFYRKLMSVKGFGANVTLSNFFDSNEYKKILRKFNPKTSVSGNEDRLLFGVTYPNKTFVFSFIASCKYYGEDYETFILNPLVAWLVAHEKEIKYYKVYQCSSYETDLTKIFSFEKKLVGKASIHDIKWEKKVYSHMIKVYPEKQSPASEGGGQNKYTCKFHCVGQWDSWRGPEQTVLSFGSYEGEAEDNVKNGYESMCKEYPFYKGGGGSASVGIVSCSSY